VGAIESKLRDAYARRHDEGKATQASLAEKLGVNRSSIHRRLNGAENMTLKTVADLVWALDCCIEIEIADAAGQTEGSAAVRMAPRALPTAHVVDLEAWDAVRENPSVTVTGDARLVAAG